LTIRPHDGSSRRTDVSRASRPQLVSRALRGVRCWSTKSKRH